MTATIIFVGADKGGVGKTMSSRVLLDLMKTRGVKVRAFDGDFPGGDLARFNKEAAIVDIARVEDQMKVFDGITDDSVTVVDLPAGHLLNTIKTLDDARLLEDVRAGTMKMVLLHVLGPTVRSIGEISAAAAKIGGVKHLLVKNHISADASYFDWDTSDTKDILAAMAPHMIDLPNMEDRIRESLEKAGTEKAGESFLEYLADPAQSRTLKGLLKTWLEKCWKEYDRVGVLTA
jgi:hypothetical protein